MITTEGVEMLTEEGRELRQITIINGMSLGA